MVQEVLSGQGNRKWIFVIVGLVLLTIVFYMAFSRYGEEYFGNRLHNMTGDSQEQTKKTLSEIEMANQKIYIPTVFQCGLDICFEVKADATNQISIDMNHTQYFINDTLRKIAYWDGGISGDSCNTISTLAPGRACFGKITEVTCTSRDFFRVSLQDKFQDVKQIMGCTK